MTQEIDLYDPDSMTTVTDEESIEVIHYCQKRGLELFYVIAKMLYYRKLDYEIGRNMAFDSWGEYCNHAGYLPDRANAIVIEFPLMDEAIRFGLAEKLFNKDKDKFPITQDKVKHARLYLEAKVDGPPDKKELEKILDIATSMPDNMSFRKWYKDKIKGNIELDPARELSITQRKAIAWDKLYELSGSDDGLVGVDRYALDKIYNEVK